MLMAFIKVYSEAQTSMRRGALASRYSKLAPDKNLLALGGMAWHGAISPSRRGLVPGTWVCSPKSKSYVDILTRVTFCTSNRYSERFAILFQANQTDPINPYHFKMQKSK